MASSSQNRKGNASHGTARAALQRGPEDGYALARLVDQCGGRIYEFALVVCGSCLDAEEVLQQSFAEAFSAGEASQGNQPPCSPLIRTAAREVLRRLNAHNPGLFTSLPDTGAGVEEELHPQDIVPWQNDWPRLYSRTDLRRILNEALEALDPALRFVVLLRDREKFSTDEISQMLGVSSTVAKSYLLWARLGLRKQLNRFARRDVEMS